MTHGGRAPQVRAKARQRVALERLTSDFGELLTQIETETTTEHPVETLAATVAGSRAMAEALGATVARLNMTPGGLTVTGWQGAVSEHPIVASYRSWTELAGRMAKLALDAGVEERLVRLKEDTFVALKVELEGALADMGLDAGQRSEVLKALAARIRARELTS